MCTRTLLPRPPRTPLSKALYLTDCCKCTCRGDIELSDIRYEPTECPPNQYLPNKVNTVCLKFTATANNGLKRPVEAANVFGFVEDKEANSVGLTTEK